MNDLILETVERAREPGGDRDRETAYSKCVETTAEGFIGIMLFLQHLRFTFFLPNKKIKNKPKII